MQPFKAKYALVSCNSVTASSHGEKTENQEGGDYQGQLAWD